MLLDLRHDDYVTCPEWSQVQEDWERDGSAARRNQPWMRAP
jgi:hypothetical protein